ncbi:hypothetical protein Tco_0155223 [Tanacetum coccineum]
MTLIEAARTMLADSKLPNTFWAEAVDIACQARKEIEPVKDYILLPLWTADPPYSQDPKSSHDDGSKPSSDDGKKVDEDPRKDSECNDQEKKDNVNSTNNVNDVGGKTSIELLFDPNMPALEDYIIFDLSRDDEDDGAEADMNNLDTTIQVSPNPTTRIHKDHPFDQVIGDLLSATQTRKMLKNLEEHGFVSTIQQRTNHKDLQNCLFACFLSHEEPKKVIHALNDPSWIEAMQEELLQFKLQEVWTLVDLPNRKRAIGSKWVFRNKKSIQVEKAQMDYINHLELGVKPYPHDLKSKEKCKINDGKYAFLELIGVNNWWTPKVNTHQISDGFEQIVDFLNVQPIRYALTVNPTIYISCIEQFWSTGVVKTINGEVQLHALVDGKKIIISEAYVRRDLQLEDEEVFLEQKLDDMPTHKRIYIAPSHTKKILGNIRRVGKGFSGRVTPLFQTMVVQNQSELGEGLAIPTDPHHTPIIIQSSTQPQKTQKPRKPKRMDTQVPQPSDPSENVADKAVYKKLGDSLVRAATIASSLEAEQGNGNITKTRSKATPNESSSLGTTSGGGPRCQETVGDTIAQLRVLDLEKTKTTQANEIATRVESFDNEEDLGEDASKQGRRINAINADKEITMVNVQDDDDNEMFDVDALNDEEVFVAGQNENVVEKLQAKFNEEERLAREKAEKEKEANIALIEEWDDIQAKIDVDHQLAERLQAQEQEELSDAEKATLFQQLLEKRRKHFAAKRAEEQRNKPPTQAQQRKIMCTYLKNMEGKKLKDLKNKSFDSIQKMFDRAFKRVNTFVDFRTDLVEGSSKRAGEELEQESTKKQKMDEAKDTTELQSLMCNTPIFDI